MIILSATRAFKAYHFEVSHNLSKNDLVLNLQSENGYSIAALVMG